MEPIVRLWEGYVFHKDPHQEHAGPDPQLLVIRPSGAVFAAPLKSAASASTSSGAVYAAPRRSHWPFWKMSGDGPYMAIAGPAVLAVLKGVSKSPQALLNSIEAVMLLTLKILK